MNRSNCLQVLSSQSKILLFKCLTKSCQKWNNKLLPLQYLHTIIKCNATLTQRRANDSKKSQSDYIGFSALSDVDPVARLESFRALKLSRLESFRAQKFIGQI